MNATSQGKRAPVQAHALDTEAVRQIVREYLLEHPEVVERAMIARNAKRRDEKRAALTDHPLLPVSGSPGGEVTLVELFDDQCGYCKRSLGPVMELLESESGLHIVWNELPVLGPVSRYAARAAMATYR